MWRESYLKLRQVRNHNRNTRYIVVALLILYLCSSEVAGMITRREFVQGTAATWMLQGAVGAAGAQSLESEGEWFDWPIGWAQLNLTEDDPAKIDVPFWLEYFKRIHADAACLSAGEVVAIDLA